MKQFKLDAFNNKANIVEKDGVSTLFSYDTEVARYNHCENKIKVNGYYSSTTGRHINAFLEFYGFDKMTKQEMLNN
jgi:hypothetical protein